MGKTLCGWDRFIACTWLAGANLEESNSSILMEGQEQSCMWEVKSPPLCMPPTPHLTYSIACGKHDGSQAFRADYEGVF